MVELRQWCSCNVFLHLILQIIFISESESDKCSSLSRCDWVSWTPWSSCSRTCGGGTRYRSRSLCCDPDLNFSECIKDCRYSSSDSDQSQRCNEYCMNGGRYNGYSCNCPDRYYGSCCSNACPSIDHCKRRHCTYAYNTKCLECNDDKTFYKKTNSDTKCERMCAWNNHYCWPGRCGDELTKGCSCAPGFRKIQTSSETSCQPTKPPSILTCDTVAKGVNGEKKRAGSSGNSTACQYLTDMYGRFQVSAFQFDLVTEYTVDITSYAKPAFINESNFGITDTTINVIKIPVSGNHSTASVHNQLVDTSSSEKVVRTQHDSGNISVILPRYNLVDGQRLCLEFDVLVGGYLKSKNVISHAISAPVSYRKFRGTRKICYRYDNTPPRHCKETGNCSDDPIGLPNRITRSFITNVEVNGWFDPIPSGGSYGHASSIESLQLTVNEVPATPGYLKVDYSSNIFTEKVTANHTNMLLNLTSGNPRLYCITLEVKDVADNVRQARRFLLYDNSSSIEKSDDNPFRITSGSAQTNFKWQTHHHNICLSWKDHFLNRFYLDNALLNPIDPAPHNLINGIYEQNSGELPVSGTSNVHGIIRFMLSWSLNGGRLSSEIAVPDFQNQSYCNDFKVKDGQTYTFAVRPVDIAGNTFTEKRTVHIDRSVPHINKVWLLKDGYKTLFVHHRTDLSKMQLYFEALDPHSGIRMIEWTFGTTDSGTELSKGALSVGIINKKSCPPNAVDCYCPDVGLCEFFNYTVPLNKLVSANKHEGNHNRNYYFTIKVTNNAYLFNIEHVDILVDESPPEVGVVYEGPEHSNDIDYTSDDNYLIHWHGFIDHESGIKAYRVGLSNRCLGQKELYNFTRIHDIEFYADVPFTESSVRIPANFTGKRYISMIALNNAMDPSEAICSDGLTRDISPPEIRNLTLEHGSWSETIVCHQGRAWLLHSSLSKILLHNVSTCSDICYNFPQQHLLASVLPTKSAGTKDPDISYFMCKRLGKYRNNTIIYLPNDEIKLEWDVEETGSQVDDFYIGIGTDPSELKSPSIGDYKSTAKRTSFKRRHEGIGSDEMFYIFVKVVNKAGLESTTIFGPVLIDETPPINKISPKAEVLEHDIRVGWENDTFYDIEQKEQISSIYFRIGHDSSFVTPLLQWNLHTSISCPQYSGGCFKYPIKRLQLSDNDLGLPFYISIHVYNNAGHSLTLKTDTFKIPSRYQPGHATVFDSDPEHESSNDVNVHFTLNSMCFRWSGFKHHESVKIEVGVGSYNLTDDISPYTTINHSDGYHCIQSSNITFQKTYYALVKASCSGGVTISASNGVTVLDRNMLEKSLNVRLGKKCSTNGLISPVFRNLTAADLSITFSADVGQRYKLVIPKTSVDCISTNDGIISANMNDNHTYDFVSFIDSSVVYTCTNSTYPNQVNQIYIYKCPADKYVRENKSISAHWFYTESKTYGLKFEIAVVQLTNTTNNNSLIHVKQYEPSRKLMSHTFSDMKLKSPECYNLAVKQCSNTQCLKPVLSEEFCISSFLEARKVQVSRLEQNIDVHCSMIVLQWESFQSDSKIAFYQWVVSKDNAASHILTEWQTVRANDTEIYQVHSCVELPVHFYSMMFGCVRAFDEAGSEGTVCQRLNYASTRKYMADAVYDFDLNSKSWASLLKALPSSDIGHLYTLLHNEELDFGTPETQVVGVILYATERNVTWFLMLKNEMPESCDLSEDCITSKTSSTGQVSFDRKFIKPNTFYFICAHSNMTVVERELFQETLGEINACSNGFVLDSEAPRRGNVELRHFERFITNLHDIELVWDGFVDNIDTQVLGYVNSIRTYSYAIGSRPYGEDISYFKNVGLKKRIAISGIDLRDGSVIYFTVNATDHAGNYATSVSKEFIVDTSPPSIGQVQTDSYDMHHDNNLYISNDKINVRLSGFKDEESGIDYFELGLGSQPFLSDVLPRVIYHDGLIHLKINGSSLTDGHKYYLTAKAINRAGLASRFTTLKVIADATPPTGGQVMEGLWKNKKDEDYQADLNEINAHWEGFSDSHSGIAYYRAGLGTKAYLDDIEAFHDVALITDITWHTQFIIGQKYYTTIEACNGAGLCVTRASDGIVIDNSPPIQGLVQIGSDTFHRKFQSHTSSVHVQWTGFEDPHSSIDHYEMCIGTKVGSCDILPNMNCLLQSNIIKTGLNLPAQTDLYATVTAFNKVRLNISHTSDSFLVDSTPPTLTIKPTFLLENNNIPGRKGQWDRSLIRLYWKFDDDESPIGRHDVTLVTHHEGHTPVEHLQLGSENNLTINLDGKSWLHNGDTYFVTVTSCNLAGLCSSEKSDDLLIDSTPPHVGGFKPPMIWENLNSSFEEMKSNITLSWYGFHDQESGIVRYFITVSKTYSGHELTHGIATVETDNSNDDNMHSFLLTEHLQRDDILFLTMWAENSVGLNSSLARVSVTVLASSNSVDNANHKGTLEIEKHSCDIQYCNKDCTCAVLGRPCVKVESNITCKEVNESLSDLDIHDVEVFNGMNEISLNITASSACLTGSWRLHEENTSLKNIMRFELSMGLYNQPIGEGIFDLEDEIPWNDVGLQRQFVHCLPDNRTLIARETYVIYLKAWISSDRYAMYRSAQIAVDHTPPSIRRGRTVIDSDELCIKDYDAIDWMNTISACWSGVFMEQQGTNIYYMLSMGTYPYGDDVFRRQNVGLNTNVTLNNISLSHGTKYFWSVTAYNNVGLHTSAISDGFVVDMDVPVSGVVFNTLKHRNSAYQSSVSSIAISWHGFQDAVSGIKTYYAAISNEPHVNKIVNYTYIGLRTSYVFLNVGLEHRKTYYSLVKAVDKVGHESAVAVSKGLTIDATPPVGYSCKKYSDIKILSKVISGNEERSMNLQFNSSMKTFYKLTGNVSSVDDTQPRLKIHIGRFHMFLPLQKCHNQMYHFQHSFFAPSVGIQNISLEAENDDKTNKTVQVVLHECSQLVEDSKEAIQLTQISRSQIAVHLFLMDEDSSLSKIELGAGTTADGFQIKPLSKIYHQTNNALIHTDAAHGCQVFVTAIAENKAGLRSVFHSSPITLDHTPPFISKLIGVLRNERKNVSGVHETFTVVQATWHVTDEESGIKHCFCSIGHEQGLSDVRAVWMSQSITYCASDVLLSHGERVYLNLKCVNYVELSTSVFTDPMVASIEAPSTHGVVLAFVPQNEETSKFISLKGSKFAIQSNHTSFELTWDGFEDLSGIDHYEYRFIKNRQKLFIDWTETDRNAIRVFGLDMASGSITAEVRAINVGSLVSESLNASLLVSKYAPRLTGHAARFTKTGKLLEVDWADVFQTVEGVPLSYSITIGTRRGYTDIADVNYITSAKYDVFIPESTIITSNLKEVFLRIVCTYSTGLLTAYDTNYKL